MSLGRPVPITRSAWPDRTVSVGPTNAWSTVYRGTPRIPDATWRRGMRCFCPWPLAWRSRLRAVGASVLRRSGVIVPALRTSLPVVSLAFHRAVQTPLPAELPCMSAQTRHFRRPRTHHQRALRIGGSGVSELLEERVLPSLLGQQLFVEPQKCLGLKRLRFRDRLSRYS